MVLRYYCIIQYYDIHKVHTVVVVVVVAQSATLGVCLFVCLFGSLLFFFVSGSLSGGAWVWCTLECTTS